ncbi:Phage protein [Vibrio crassostreae]|nr:Phage protein [Vibrio crassostreae]
MILDIHTGFQSLIADAQLGIDVKYENLSFQPKLKTAFGIFQLGAVPTERQGQGACTSLNYSGEATLTIKTDINTGVNEAYQLADKLIKFIMENGLYSGLKMIETPYVGATEQEFDWLVLPIFIPYQKDS